MNTDIPKRWVGGICVHNNKILLVYRIDKEKTPDQEYFVFPGKLLAGDESLETALCSAFKETSLTVKLKDLLYSKEDPTDDSEYYYTCEYILGEPSFIATSDEVALMKDGRQVFTPMWVPLEGIDNLILYPESVKVALLERLEEEKS